MKNILKACRNWVRFNLFFQNNDISLSANISKNTILGYGTSIGMFSSINNSKLGAGTKIEAHCSLNKVILEGTGVIYSNVNLTEVEIGKFSYVAPGSRISRTSIGKFCSIGPELICGYGNHPIDWISTSPVFFSTAKQCGISFSNGDFFEELKKIKIGHDVWIGARVFIRDGVTIGNGAVLAAGAVVVNSVPDYAIVGGVPAKVIRYRFPPEEIQKLNDLAWWNWSDDKLKKLQPYFVQGKIQILLDAEFR